jgi:electron transfer flavoprotein beta subunit
MSAFKIDPDEKRAVPPPGIPPVVNGFDENAVEAALLIKDSLGATVTVVSVGHDFALDVMKKPLSMGADRLVLVDDAAVDNLDAYATAYALSETIKKIGEYDLVLCGIQASDYDNAHVPLGVAEMLGLPCVTSARKIEVSNRSLSLQKSIDDGYQVVSCPTPAVVTVTSELGEPRYPTLRGIMTASRKTPTVWSVSDIGLDPDLLAPRIEIAEMFMPVQEQTCEIIEGEDGADAGRKLALRLREERLI